MRQLQCLPSLLKWLILIVAPSSAFEQLVDHLLSGVLVRRVDWNGDCHAEKVVLEALLGRRALQRVIL